jgi:hypothetical protein
MRHPEPDITGRVRVRWRAVEQLSVLNRAGAVAIERIEELAHLAGKAV